MIYYENSQIKIRDIFKEDVISLFSCWIDKEINRFDPRPLPNDSKSLKRECHDYCAIFDSEKMNVDPNKNQYKYFIITDKSDNFIGFVNFFGIDKVNKQGELGITIGDKRYWRKGIAHTAIKVAEDYIFNHMNIERIYIQTGETNKPALGLFNKLGYKKCDEYIEDDNFKFIVMDKKKL